MKTGSISETNNKSLAPIRLSKKTPSLDRIKKLLDKKQSKKKLKVKL